MAVDLELLIEEITETENSINEIISKGEEPFEDDLKSLDCVYRNSFEELIKADHLDNSERLIRLKYLLEFSMKYIEADDFIKKIAEAMSDDIDHISKHFNKRPVPLEVIKTVRFGDNDNELRAQRNIEISPES